MNYFIENPYDVTIQEKILQCEPAVLNHELAKLKTSYDYSQYSPEDNSVYSILVIAEGKRHDSYADECKGEKKHKGA